MPSRRHFLLAAGAAICAGPALAALPAAAARPLSFRISRSGFHIGTHSLAFQQAGDALAVTVDVDISVGFWPIRLFHYAHHNIERWNAGRLESMDATTDYDGTPAFAILRREDGRIVAEGSRAARYTAPAGTLAATHWNKAELLGPMVNPENGMLLRPAISDRGMESIVTASGAKLAARHYAWRGADMLDLWYEPDGTWAALTAVAEDGSSLVYEKL